jgi:hypothetical protein
MKEYHQHRLNYGLDPRPYRADFYTMADNVLNTESVIIVNTIMDS